MVSSNPSGTVTQPAIDAVDEIIHRILECLGSGRGFNQATGIGRIPAQPGEMVPADEVVARFNKRYPRSKLKYELVPDSRCYVWILEVSPAP